MRPEREALGVIMFTASATASRTRLSGTRSAASVALPTLPFATTPLSASHLRSPIRNIRIASTPPILRLNGSRPKIRLLRSVARSCRLSGLPFDNHIRQTLTPQSDRTFAKATEACVRFDTGHQTHRPTPNQLPQLIDGLASPASIPLVTAPTPEPSRT